MLFSSWNVIRSSVIQCSFKTTLKFLQEQLHRDKVQFDALPRSSSTQRISSDDTLRRIKTEFLGVPDPAGQFHLKLLKQVNGEVMMRVQVPHPKIIEKPILRDNLSVFGPLAFVCFQTPRSGYQVLY